jgi:two-component system response regulator MprA
VDRKKVLLVEDDRGVRESLGRALQTEDYDVTAASSGPEALGRLREQSFHLALLDLDLPVVTGWGTFDQMRAAHPALPVILITGRPHHQLVAAQKRATTFLEKPFEIDVMLRVIKEVIAQNSQVQLTTAQPS